jgi:CHAT domain-containing protein/cytochrome c-type biogenesis protein CcmH/NrfG
MSGFDGKLETLKSTAPAVRGAECPDPAVWREVVVALTPSEEALEHLQHASRCDYCGPILREAVAQMNANITEEEAKKIAALESASSEWQRGLAHRIAGTPERAVSAPWWKAWVPAPRLALAGVALAVIVAGSWLAFRQASPQTPSDLLAKAYSQQRTFELRMAGADYAPVRVQRGGDGSFMSRPAALLKAEARIAAEIGSHPSDPNWLQAEARADLLEGKYDAAVTALRHALQIAPKTPSLLIDLGTAYFQRAQSADRPEDLGAAYESLSQALATEPENSVALFNRAIVAEHQFLYRQALDDWDHYLRMDASSEWATEARQRADALRAKLKEHDQSHAQPLLTPAQIAAQLGNADLHNVSASPMVGSAELRAQVDQRVEEYLREAVRTWLPQAYPGGNASSNRGAVQALFFLADITARQHGDRWLSDLLRGASSANFPQAASAMAAARKASDGADYGLASQQAEAAAHRFETSGNTAGFLYAEFQQAYAAQFLRHIPSCRDWSSQAESESEKFPYWWLQIQLGLERGVCSGMSGNVGLDQKLSRQAMDRAQRAGYGALFLRALSFEINDRFQTNDPHNGWSLLNSALARYWSGQFPLARGYNLYEIGADAAASSERPRLDLALRQEVLSLVGHEENLSLRAAAESEAGQAAAAAGQMQVADHHYSEAARLSALVPQNEAFRAFALYSQIRSSQLESSLGNFDEALGRLTNIQEEVARLSESYLVQMFYSALGEVQLSQRHYAEAEQALRPALALAKLKLGSLHSDEERVQWSKNASPVYLGLAEASFAQGRSQESLEIFESYLEMSEQGGSSKTRATPPLSGVSSRLPLLSNVTVISYGVLPHGVALWSYDDRGVSSYWIDGKGDEILELAARLNELSSEPSSDLQAFRRDARKLYDFLIAPIEQRFDPQRAIVVETDASLSRLPFEALLDPSGHYLLERAPIVHSFGTYHEEGMLPRIAVSPDSSVLVIAGTAGFQADELAPLPDVEAESEAVASHFHDARILRGRQATVKAVGEGLRNAAIFHFAGHSLANSQDAGLVMGDVDPQTGRPRLLDAEMLQKLHPTNLQLAVLSACSTAQSSTEDASGISSVTGALLRAGVPHVVASRWPVDSVQTRIFFEDFYRNLLNGAPVAEASRTTARKMLANRATTHPYYWSAFAAYGRP